MIDDLLALLMALLMAGDETAVDEVREADETDNESDDLIELLLLCLMRFFG